jgi:hypothetical protein
MRHPIELGGVYFVFNAITNQLSVIVSAFLYLPQYYVPPTGANDVLRAAQALSNNTVDGNSTSAADASYSSASNHSLAGFTNASFANTSVSAANYTFAGAASAGLSLSVGSTINPLALFALVGTLVAMWAIAVLGLWFTINSDYRRTFLSTQTGCAFSRSYFLDNDGDDAKRINIFWFFFRGSEWPPRRRGGGRWLQVAGGRRYADG